MIPLPSLLVVECDPSLRDKATDDGESADACQNGTDSDETVSLPTKEEASTNNRKDETNRSAGIKRRRRRKMETAIPPPTPPSPLRLRRILKSTPPRVLDVVGGGGRHPRAPFWERQQREEEQERSHGRHTVASIQRRSQLCIFLVTLASFAMFDEYLLLPSGILLYAVTLSMAWENWANEAEENLRYAEILKQYHLKLQRVENEIQKARFEYHVLRNQPHVDIVALRRTTTKQRGPDGGGEEEYRGLGLDFDPDDHWIVYADETRRRRPQRQHQEWPPKHWRTISETHN